MRSLNMFVVLLIIMGYVCACRVWVDMIGDRITKEGLLQNCESDTRQGFQAIFFHPCARFSYLLAQFPCTFDSLVALINSLLITHYSFFVHKLEIALEKLGNWELGIGNRELGKILFLLFNWGREAFLRSSQGSQRNPILVTFINRGRGERN